MANKKYFTDESLKAFVNRIKIYVSSYVNNAISTKANVNHTHAISDVTNLQSQLDSKAASSHNHSASNITNGTLSTDRLPTIPISKGGTGAITASAALVNLGLTATASELNVLDGITAATKELNYVDGVTSNIQIQLNNKLSISGGSITGPLSINSTNTSGNGFIIRRNSSASEQVVHTVDDSTYRIKYTNDEKSNNVIFELHNSDTEGSDGSGKNTSTVTINGSSSGSKVTASQFIGALSGNATSATKATKDGSDNTIVSTYETKADATSKLTQAKTYTDEIAATKAASSHNHSAANITSGTLSSDRLPTIPISKGGTGSTTAAGALTNLGITATASELNKLDGVTATTTELNYVDGVTSNIQTQLNSKAASSHTHTDIKEAYLTWGGKNFSSSFGCLDAAMIQDLGANRFSFAKAAGVTIEYSRDSGASWTDYGSSNVAKSSLFTSNGYSHLIGKADSSNKATAAYQLRVTLNATSGGIYTVLNKFCIYVSTNGSSGTTCTIQIAKTSAPSTYTTIVDSQAIGGWSGYNIINCSGFTFGSNSDQYNNLRFIFKSTGGSDTYNGLQIMSIQGFGGVGWSTPSNMAKTGHLYSFDGNQNATFPASIAGTGTFSMNRKSGTTVGNYSVAIGYNNEASDQYAYAEGVDTKATDYAAHAEGDRTEASGSSSHAEGQSTIASGLEAHAEGRATTASGNRAHAEGTGTTASATNAHAEGGSTSAESMNSHAEGVSTIAKGFQSHAEGNYAIASGSSSHAEGDRTTASGLGSHAEGVSTNKAESITTSIVNSDIITAWGTSKFSLAKGEGSHVEGKDCIALENYSHAEGHGTMASGIYGSHAEGDETVASGQSSHAEGSDTEASGLEAHAEGNGCVASGSYSHAEGRATKASGIYSHTQNIGTEASGNGSTAMGLYTKASSLNQTVIGKYNTADTSDTYAFIIGNGESDSERSNALTVDWSGNEWLAGGLTVDGQFRYKAGTTTTLKPYYTKGDSFTITSLQTAGYLTSSNTEVHFTIPLDRPLIGVSTVTVSTVNGFILRQENKYTHGSAASTRVKPTSYGAAHYYASHIQAVAKFTTTTNSINNSAIGIDANIKVTFS